MTVPSVPAGPRVEHHRTLGLPQLHVAVQDSGPGVPLAFSHALGLDLTLWDGMAAALAGEHPLLRYDHRGQGGSAVPPGPYTLDELVDDAARVLREWGRGPVMFVGLSMGGMVAQGLAIRYPELVRGLLLANTTAQYPKTAQPLWDEGIAAVAAGGIAAIAEAMMARFLSAEFRSARPAATAALRERLLRTDAAGYIATCQAIRRVNWLDELGRIACPTAVLAGGRDEAAPVAMGRAIAERIAGASFEVFDEGAHLSVAEQPQRFEAAVRALIARCA